ncbi:MAG: DUF2339 domain-containing protein [Pseudobdellovibrionaceae bacterium]|jgi:uncharacterized membrane protein|nr:DUF2339 domain-containing protein [Pseudobdellovibrionaceae bacterium]
MEAFFILIAVALGFGIVILPWINLFRHNSTYGDVWKLRQRISLLEEKISFLETAAIKSTPIPAQETALIKDDAPPNELHSSPETETVAEPDSYEQFDCEDDEAPKIQPSDIALHKIPETKKSAEFNFATRLSVWIGSISLAFAAFFLIKLSYHAGLLGPETRVLLGMVFGGGLVASSLYIVKRPFIANAERVSQGLAGAGLISLSFSIYSASHIHEYISATAGFFGMSAVVGATLVLSLRLGAPVALFGMIGGFISPILFSSSEPNVTGLLAYLFILFSGIQFLGSRRGWSLISYLSLGATALWIIFLLAYGHNSSANYVRSGDISLFLLGVCGASFIVHHLKTKDTVDENFIKSSNASRLPILTTGVCSILILLSQNTLGFGMLEWGVTCSISLALVILSALRPKLYGTAVWWKLGIDIFTYATYAGDAVQYHKEYEILILLALSVIYVGISSVLLHATALRPAYWSRVQIISALALFLTARADFGALSESGLIAPWGMIALAAAIYCIIRTQIFIGKSLDGAKGIAGSYALGATSFLSLGMALELDTAYLPLAFAAELAAVIGIHRYLNLSVLPKIAYALFALVAALSLTEHEALLSMMGSALTDKHVYISPAFDGSPLHILSTLLLPALFVGIGYALHVPSVTFGAKNKAMSHILGGLSILLGLSGIYALLRFANLHIDLNSPVIIGFFDRAAFTAILAAIGICGHHLISNVAGAATYKGSLRFLSNALIFTALLRIFFFDLIGNNPVFDRLQHIGALPVLNGATFIYGLGLGLALFSNKFCIGLSRMPFLTYIYRGLILIFLLALVTLNIRQLFSPDILTKNPVENIEMYLYSVAWMITGMGLLAYGIKCQDKPVRIAALAFLALTIGKVFLIDSSHLEGIYKVFSFLGLGISLIGLSSFYTRYMSKLDQENRT